MNENKIKIEVTNREAEAFKTLSPHFVDLAIMLEKGVFTFKNGRVIIHRDSDGKLRKIDFETTLFRL